MKAATDRKMQSVETFELGVQRRLETELQSLKEKLKLGHGLDVRWIPSADKQLSGQVKGNCILVYEEDASEALQTLRHEFLDYAISIVIEPYKQVTNKLIALINEEAYRRKEKVVEALIGILDKSTF
jgi:hypothetical protein